VNADGQPDHLLVMEIEPSEHVHANNRDEVFLRVGDENRKLSFVQRQELLYDKGQAVYESTPAVDTSTVELHPTILTDYAAALGHPEPERLLVARGFVTGGGLLTVGGLLLFARSPQGHLPNAHVRVLRYQGTERGSGSRQRLLEDVRCEGPIPQVLADAREAVRRLQPTRRALAGSGRFEPIGLVPEDAWLEGLVNAVVHRSYSIGGDHIRIDVFDDRIEVESPGRFPGLADARDPLNATRFARNPRIARVCADLHFGQELGEGIRRMFQEMRFAGLADPLYRQSAASVRLTLSGVPVDRKLEARLPPDSRDVLAALREAGRLGTGELSQVLQVSRPVAIRRLDRLQELGLIEWVGNSPKDPRAYWQLRL
jgi:ATP-dependent DNA helicase RecG